MMNQGPVRAAASKIKQDLSSYKIRLLQIEIMNRHKIHSPSAQPGNRNWHQMVVVFLIVIGCSVDTPAWELECNP